MSATKQRQINIRDGEIYDRAHRLARRLKVPMKEAVRAALKAYEASAGATPKPDTDMARRLEELELLTARIAKVAIRRSHEEDDAALYGPDGLPL